MTIDELVVTLALDPKKFTAGQKQALDSFKKTSEEAVKRAKEIEAAGGRAAEFFSGLRNQALGLFAILAGGKGIKEFVSYITTSDAALGRLSRNIGVSANVISAWQGAARIFGGSAEAMAGSFTSLSDALAGWKIGKISPIIADLMAIGVAGGHLFDVNASVEENLIKLGKNFEAINARDPAQAGLMGRMIGADPALFDLLISGKLQQTLREINIVTKQNTDQAGALAQMLNKVLLAFENLGRIQMRGASPLLEGFLSLVNRFLVALGPHANRATDSFLRRYGWGGSKPSGAASTTSGTSIPLKAGASAGGDTSLGILSLAHSLQSDIREITALNDVFHKTGKHPQGLAMDFSLNDPSKSAEVAAKIRAKIGNAGTVIDEYLHPSKNSTGPHIHVQFNNAAAAQRYADQASAAGGGITSSNVSNRNSETNIQTLNVYTQATGSEGTADAIRAAILRRMSFVNQAEGN